MNTLNDTLAPGATQKPGTVRLSEHHHGETCKGGRAPGVIDASPQSQRRIRACARLPAGLMPNGEPALCTEAEAHGVAPECMGTPTARNTLSRAILQA